MACNDKVIHLQSRIESVMDYAHLQDVYATEWHLLSRRAFELATDGR